VRQFRGSQPSFAAGELSPALHARVDLAKFKVGLKTCHNWLVHTEGGASNRPGFVFTGEAKDSDNPVRLIPLTFSTTQTYMLEFGELYMRVIKDGGYVVEADVAVSTVSAATPPVVTTTGAHGYSDGDDIFLVGVADAPTGPYRVANKTATTFELTDYRGNNIDGTGWGAP